MRIHKAIAIPFCIWVFCSISVEGQAQESAESISVYALSMNTQAIRDILKDGISGDEWKQLMGETFAQSRLSTGDGPIQCKEGVQKIVLSPERKKELAQSNGVSLVFVFLVRAPKDAIDTGGSIQRHHYGLKNDGSLALERNNSWSYPPGSARYRYLDFRSAQLLGFQKFVYEIQTDFGMEKTYTLEITDSE